MAKIAIGSWCALALVVASSVHAEPKVGLGVDQGFGVTIQLEDRINLTLGDDGVAGDYLFRKGVIDPSVPATWYIGVGAFAGWDDGLGVRLPLGVEMNFDQRWDGYVQLAPAIDFDNHNDHKGHHDHADLDIDAAIGIRYAF